MLLFPARKPEPTYRPTTMMIPSQRRLLTFTDRSPSSTTRMPAPWIVPPPWSRSPVKVELVSSWPRIWVGVGAAVVPGLMDVLTPPPLVWAGRFGVPLELITIGQAMVLCMTVVEGEAASAFREHA